MQGFAFCNERYGNLPILEVVSRLATHGYNGVELDARTLPGLDLAATRARCEQMGVPVIGLHWLLAGRQGLHLTHPSPEIRRATLAHLRGLVAGCAELGGRVMVLGSGQARRVLEGVTHEEALGYAEELLRALGEDLVARGVRLGLEPLSPGRDNLMPAAEIAAELADRIGCPNIGITLDARAMATEGKPREELVERFLPHLVHVHVNDDGGSGPGMGETDLAPMLRTLKAAGYEGWISVETFDTDLDPDAVARESLLYLRDCWSER